MKKELEERIKILAKVLPNQLMLTTLEEILSRVHWEGKDEDETLLFAEVSELFVKECNACGNKYPTL